VKLARHHSVIRGAIACALLVSLAGAASNAAGQPQPDPSRPIPAPPPDPRVVPALSMTAAWTATLPAPASAPAEADAERAYVPLASGSVVAVSLSDGTVVWTVPAPELLGSPVSGDGLVFLAFPRRVEARDVRTGSIRWQAETAAPATAPLFWGNGWLLAIVGEGDATMYRAGTGEVLWTHALGAPSRAKPAAAGSRVYVLLDDGRVLARALETGAAVWESRLPGRPTTIRPLDDRVFVGCTDRFFYCLAADTGKTKWRWRTGATIVGTASVDEDSVYFLSLDGVLRSLDRGNGHQRWKTPVPHQPTTGPFLSARLLLVPGISTQIPAFSTRDGKPSGAAKLVGEPSALPSFLEPVKAGAGGRLLVIVDDKAQLLEPSAPPLKSTPLPGPPYTLPPEIEDLGARIRGVQISTGALWRPASSSLMTRARRCTPSTIFSFEGSEKDNRMTFGPPPSTKKALPAT
jgi:outer membrane protein assembly factor BamB